MLNLGEAGRTEFRGESRTSVAAGLLRLWDHLLESPQRVWVSLEGEQGVGKTRIVHEFYTQLSARQRSPLYWPRSIVGEEVPARVRKYSGPREWHREPDALPAYVWLGFSGSWGDGLPTSQLARDLAQLDPHMDYIRHQAGALYRLGASISEVFRDMASMTVDDVIAQGAGVALKTVAVPVPGLSYVTGALWSIADLLRQEVEVRRRLGARELMQPGGISASAQDRFIAQVGFTVARMGVVLFVEDMHHTDPLLIDVLRRLLAEEGGSLLVITTEWDVNGGRLNGAAGERRISITKKGVTSPSPALSACFAPEASLADLSVPERTALVEDAVPSSHREVAELVAESNSNLQMLLLTCELGRVQTALSAGTLTSHPMTELPRSIEQFLDESWTSLDSAVQDHLARLSLISPASVEEQARSDSSLGFDERFDVSLSPGKEALVDDAVQGHWLVSDGPPLYEFVGRPRRQLALRVARDDGLAQETWSYIAKRTHQPTWSNEVGADDVHRQTVRDSLIITLARAGYSVEVRRLLEASTRLAVRLRDAFGDIPLVADISHIAVEAARREKMTENALAKRLAEMWGRAAAERGDYTLAFQVLRPLIEDRPIADLNRDALRIEWLYARSERRILGIDPAMKRLERVAREQERLLGRRAGDLLMTKCDIAFTQAQRGHFEAAEGVLREVLATSWEAGFEPDRDRAEHQLASVLRRRGQLAEAHEILLGLAYKQRLSRGRTHPDVLATQQLLVAVLRDRGRLTEALEQATSLWQTSMRVLGRSQQTRDARSNLAWVHRKRGDYELAANMFAQLVEESSEVDGGDWTTLRDRHNEAVCRRDSGRLGEAIAALTEVQALYRARDSDRIAIIETIRERARTLLMRYGASADSADCEAGLTLMREALSEAKRARDMSTPMWWQLQIDAACAEAASAGWSADNIDHLGALCRDQLVALGQHHPEVLRSELYLAEAHRRRGRTRLASIMVDDVESKVIFAQIDSRHWLGRAIAAARGGKLVIFT